MEGPLDLEALAEALDVAPTLPTAEELQRLMAAAEISLFRNQPEATGRLLLTGWYLHGVASRVPAVEIYSVAQQRRAFQVSAHIFDLAMNDEDLERVELLRLAFGAQIGYIRSDLAPNAIAIARRVQSTEVNFPQDSHVLALDAGVSLLGFDRPRLFPRFSRLRDQVRRFESDAGVQSLRGTIHGGPVEVLRGCRRLLVFLAYGASAGLDEAREALSFAASDLDSNSVDSAWVAVHLLHLLDDLGRSSPWTVLGGPLPPGPARAMAMGHPPVLSLWPPQLQLLETADHESSPLLPDTRRLVLSFPTSAGKTLLAQIFVLSHLALDGGGVCFIAPTHSLCREIREAMYWRLRAMGATVGEDLPEGVSPSNADADVEVVTPERLSYMLRTDPAGVLDRFSLFVVDEAHIVGDESRGWLLESALTFLHHATRETAHRIIVMSAAIGNRLHIHQWLDPTSTQQPFHSDWRGPRRLHAVYTTDVDWQERAVHRPTPKSKKRAWYPLHGVVRLRVDDSGRDRQLRTTSPVGSLARVIDDDGSERQERDQKQSTAFYETLVPLATVVANAGPVLLIHNTRVNAALLAGALARSIEAPASPGAIQLAEFIELRLGLQHPLSSIVRSGVAYHHAALPADVQGAIEEAFRGGDLNYLVATTSLTEGVNLPVRTVIIAALGTYSSEGEYREFLTGPRLLNAIGRAGRATKESEGWVILAANEADSGAFFDHLDLTSEDISALSVLGDPDSLALVADFEESVAANGDQIYEVAGSIVSDFISFIWFVATALEGPNGSMSDDDLDSILRSTLAWQQLGSGPRGAWSRIGTRALAAYRRSDADQRLRWGRSGTSLAAARQIEGLAVQLSGLAVVEPRAALAALVEIDAINVLTALPGAPKSTAKPSRNTKAEDEVAIDTAGLLDLWLAGGELDQLAADFFSFVGDEAFRYEQLGDFISAVVEQHLPFVIGLATAWANHHATVASAAILGESIPVEAICAELAAYVRYGIDTSIGLDLLKNGIRSRRLARVIVEHFDSEPDDADVYDWLGEMTVADWLTEFEASPIEIIDLLSVVRPKSSRLLASFFASEATRIPLRDADLTDGSAVTVDVLPGDGPRGLGAWIEGSLVGTVRTQYQSDLHAILDTGLPFSAIVEVADPEVHLVLQLLRDREDEAVG